MKKLFIALAILSGCFPLIAQRTIDAVTLSGRYGLSQAYTDTYSGEATESGLYFGLTYGKVVSQESRTMVLVNVNHFYFNVQGDPSIPSGIANPININGTIVRAGIYQKFGDGHGFRIMVAPRYMSDYKNPDGNSLQMGAVVGYEKDFHEDLLIGFGATYNSEFFGPYVVPVVDLDWKLNSNWSIVGMLPIYAKVNYKINKNLTAGFSHFGLITSYYLGDEAYEGDYMERQSIDLSLFLRQRLFGNFFIEGRVGRTFGRSYTQFSGDQKISFGLPLISFGDNRTSGSVHFSDGMLFDLRLVLNMIKTEF